LNEGLPAVLVVSGGGFQGLALVRLLAEADGYRVLVADTHTTGVTAAFADRLLQLPPVAQRDAFEGALAELCRAEGVRLVLPSTDHELEALAELRPRLGAAGVSVAVCERALLSELRDKRRLYASLAAAGLPVLTAVPLSAEPLPLPLIGKPRQGWGGRGVVIVRRRDELLAIPAAEREARVWQPFLEGAREMSADFAIRRDGTLPVVGLRERVRTSGGFAVVSDTVVDAEAELVVRRFAGWAAARGGRGAFNVQLLRQGALLVVSDVNPRLGTSAVHWRGTGFNPLLTLCAEAGLAPAGSGEATPPVGVRSLRYLEELVQPPAPDAAAVQGVVFDLDDTLVPMKQWLLDRLTRALDQVVSPAERDRAQRQGRRIIEEGPRDRLIDALATALGWGAERRDSLLQAYRANWPVRCATYPDVKPALDALRRRGLRLGVLTDNPPDTQRRKLEAAGLLPFLDAVVYSREAGDEKPARRGFTQVAAALGIEPERLAMVGDNPHRDLAGAAEAGFGRLFWVRRSAASCGFDPVLANALPGRERYEQVAGLRDLGARLARS
jgi:FMN phosphatase YigB (HAD superfamily)/carbamoylphosphate synthase large subunit